MIRIATDLWAWIALKPGTLPRRAARHVVVAIASFTVKRPRFAGLARRLLTPFPSLRKRLQPTVLYAVHRDLALQDFFGADDLNLSAEPESAREIYRRLVHARKRVLATN